MGGIDGLEGRELAKHFGCRFIETSAKQRLNVDEAFSDLVREIRKYNKVSCLSPLCPIRNSKEGCMGWLGTSSGSTGRTRRIDSGSI